MKAQISLARTHEKMCKQLSVLAIRSVEKLITGVLKYGAKNGLLLKPENSKTASSSGSTSTQKITKYSLKGLLNAPANAIVNVWICCHLLFQPNGHLLEHNE